MATTKVKAKDTSTATVEEMELKAVMSACPEDLKNEFLKQGAAVDRLASQNALTRAKARFEHGLDDYALCKAFGCASLLASSNHYVPYALEAAKLTKRGAPNFKLLGTVKQLKGGTTLYCHENGGKDGPGDVADEKELPVLLDCLERFKKGEKAPSEGKGASATTLETTRTNIANHGDGESKEKWSVAALEGIIDLAQSHITKRS